MTVYIDVLFLSNWIINSIIVCCAGALFRDGAGSLKIIIGGALLSLYSVIMFFPHTHLLYTVSGKLLCTALFVLVYYRPQNLWDLLKKSAAFLTLSLILCGVSFVFAACVFKSGTVSNGVPYFDIDLKGLLAAAAVSFVIIKLTSDIFIRNLSRSIVKLDVCLNGRITQINALIDTGCELRERITGKPVLLISGQRELSGGIPIALSTVASGKIIYAVSADRIKCRDKKFGVYGNCLVSFINTEFSYDGLYNAIAPPDAFYIKHKKLFSGGYRMKQLTNLLKKLLERAYLRLVLKQKNNVHYIGGSDTLPPPLEKEEEQIWIARLHEPDFADEARKLLIEHNLRLVVYIAKRFDTTGIGIEDLISIGTIGLIKAINTFKPEKKIKLATYASRCIENEILMYLRKNNGQKTEVSIDEPLNVDWDGKELLLSDILGTDGDVTQKNIEDETDRELLRIALDGLGCRERNIVEMRFGINRDGDEMTQKEVADLLGISQSYISRLEKRIIKRLRKDMTKMLTG